jgi:hypothetical protein
VPRKNIAKTAGSQVGYALPIWRGGYDCWNGRVTLFHPRGASVEMLSPVAPLRNRAQSSMLDWLDAVAKMDLVESKAEKSDLFTALEVCPVDYKAGAPKEGEAVQPATF